MTDAPGRVLLIRPVGVDRDGAVLAERGVVVESDAYLTVGESTDADALGRVDAVLAEIAHTANWLVTTSRAAPEALAAIATPERLDAAIASGSERGLRFAAVGVAAAGALRAHGATDVLVPTQQDAEGLLTALLEWPVARVVAPLGNLARPLLADGLREHGWTVVAPIVYVTAPVPERPHTADRLAGGEFDVVVLRSPSAVSAMSQFVPALPDGVSAVCGGRTTAAAARRYGFARIVVSDEPSAESVADAVVRALAGPGASAVDWSEE